MSFVSKSYWCWTFLKIYLTFFPPIKLYLCPYWCSLVMVGIANLFYWNTQLNYCEIFLIIISQEMKRIQIIQDREKYISVLIIIKLPTVVINTDYDLFVTEITMTRSSLKIKIFWLSLQYFPGFLRKKLLSIKTKQNFD